MKPDQRHSPKYWVAHDTTTDDVILETATKSLYDTQVKLDDIYRVGIAYDFPERFKFILVEIKEVVI